jgi:hypothetical protein
MEARGVGPLGLKTFTFALIPRPHGRGYFLTALRASSSLHYTFNFTDGSLPMLTHMCTCG